MLIPLGYEQREYFNFPNNYKVYIDYGLKVNTLSHSKEKYIPGAERSEAPYRRLMLLKNDKVVIE